MSSWNCEEEIMELQVPDGNVICGLSGASWVSALICGRIRNPKTGAECSQSWSATGSTAQSPAGSPPPPTSKNQNGLFFPGQGWHYQNHADHFWSTLCFILPCIFETHAGMLHPHWQVIRHVDLKVFKRINLQCLENASTRYAPDQKVWAPNFLSYFSFFHEFVRESPETLSHQPAQIGCQSSWPQQSVSLCELMWVFFQQKVV